MEMSGVLPPHHRKEVGDALSRNGLGHQLVDGGIQIFLRVARDRRGLDEGSPHRLEEADLMPNSQRPRKRGLTVLLSQRLARSAWFLCWAGRRLFGMLIANL
jgi:hypothetical protein